MRFRMEANVKDQGQGAAQTRAAIEQGKLRGAEALAALHDQGRLFGWPYEVAAVFERDQRTIYAGIRNGEIPCTKIGPRHQIPLAWVDRQVDGDESRRAGRVA